MVIPIQSVITDSITCIDDLDSASANNFFLDFSPEIRYELQLPPLSMTRIFGVDDQ